MSRTRSHHPHGISNRAIGLALALAAALLAMQFCSPGLGRSARMAWSDRPCSERVVDGPSGPILVGNCD